ncbi:MAG: hypothetical protein ACJ8E1_06030 [Xanthobacteraceae bacterium]|jgi:hypothetical protein
MTSLDEDVAAAKAAKKALGNLSPNVGATIRHAMDVAAHPVPSDWRLNDAHRMVVDALSNLLNAPEDALSEKVEDRAQFVPQGHASWIASIASFLKLSFIRSGRSSMYFITT